MYGTPAKFNTKSRWPSSNNSLTWSRKATSRKHIRPVTSMITTPETSLDVIATGIAPPELSPFRSQRSRFSEFQKKIREHRPVLRRHNRDERGHGANSARGDTVSRLRVF